MASDGGGRHPYIGGIFLVAGAATLTLAFLPSSMAAITALPLDLPTVRGVPGDVAVVGLTGVALTASGVKLLGSAPAASADPAENRPTDAELEPERRPDPPTSPTGTTVERTGSRNRGPVTKEEKRMDSLEEKIEAIDRRMSQAKVKLGTGEISPEGYQKVMEELEEKRAQLEKERVDLELDSSDI
jgi:hypothetical protein